VAAGHRVRCAGICVGADFAPPDDVAMAEPPATDAPLVLELRRVSLRYPGRKTFFRRATGVDAVRDVSLSVRSGEFVGIVGESGSGKSSVARLVMGLERPTAGEIVLEGGRQIVFQDPQSALNPRRRVFSLVTQALEVAGHHVDSGERLRRALALLEETGLPLDCLPRVPSQLSGGQKQRVNISRALCVTPKLLVADEIVSGLDVSVQAQILNLLLRLGRELEFSLLFISHDLAVVRYLCTRVAVMHRGRIVESGETEKIFANPQHEYTRSLLAAVPSGPQGLSDLTD
jgi:peptide/nickel transport system ATP-binding protein